MNKVGIGVSNMHTDLEPLLSVGYGLYLIHSTGVDDGYSLEQAVRIRERHPGATILHRIMGGMPTDVAGFADEAEYRYRTFRERIGPHHLIPWNEVDLEGEGGATAEQVAAFSREWAPRFKFRCPDAVLHFPAFSAERFYQSPLQETWLPAAWAHFGVLDLHVYEAKDHEPLSYVDAYLRWWSTVAFRRPNGRIMPSCITEWNHNPDLPRPHDYPMRVYNFYARCYQWLWCLGGCPFIWEWQGHRGKVDIATDQGAVVATREAARALPGIYQTIDLSPLFDPAQPLEPVPEPEPEPSTDLEDYMGVITAMYLHQFGGPNRNYRERTYAEFARTAARYGVTQIWFKAWQGGVYSQAWDPHPLAFRDAEECRRCYEECASEGVEAVFWGVPEAQTWWADAQIAIEIAAVAGGKIHIDLEMFADFWNAPTYGVRDVPAFFRTVHTAGVTIEVSAVMRFGEPELIPWDEFADTVSLLYSQSYWTDFRDPDSVRVVLQDLHVMQALGFADRCGVVLPRDGTRQQLDAAWEAVKEDVKGVAIWVWDYSGEVPFEFLSALPVAPKPTADNGELYAAVISESHEIVAAAAEMNRLCLPISQGGPDISDAEAVGGILHAVSVIRAHSDAALSLATQIRT